MQVSPGDCARCGRIAGRNLFCAHCGVLRGLRDRDLYAASRSRRLGGALLESLLFLATLGLGWLIWLYFTAQTSQTPAKRLLSMWIVMGDGSPATAERVWLREVGIEGLLFGVAGAFVGPLPSLLDGAWILWDRDRQTLHDKLADTLVVYAPQGIGGAPGSQRDAPGGPPPGAPDAYTSEAVQRQLRALRALYEQGGISTAEYERRRRRILDDA